MQLSRTPIVAFVFLALVTSICTFYVLFLWAGSTQAMRWFGVYNFWQVGMLIIISMVISATSALYLFSEAPRSFPAGFGFGVLVALLTYIGTVVFDCVLVWFLKSDFTLAILIGASAFAFGGIIFGLPSMLLGGIVGASLSRETAPL